jgi:hypothetical protein
VIIGTAVTIIGVATIATIAADTGDANGAAFADASGGTAVA